MSNEWRICYDSSTETKIMSKVVAGADVGGKGVSLNCCAGDNPSCASCAATCWLIFVAAKYKHPYSVSFSYDDCNDLFCTTRFAVKETHSTPSGELPFPDSRGCCGPDILISSCNGLTAPITFTLHPTSGWTVLADGPDEKVWIWCIKACGSYVCVDFGASSSWVCPWDTYTDCTTGLPVGGTPADFYTDTYFPNPAWHRFTLAPCTNRLHAPPTPSDGGGSPLCHNA